MTWLRLIAALVAFGIADTVSAGGLPTRAGVADPQMRRLDVARADLAFALRALLSRPTGTATAIPVSDRRLPAEIAAAAQPADVAWAAAVGRTALVLEIMTGREAPRDMLAQSFDGHFAISVPAYGQVVGNDPDQVLGALGAMIEANSRGRAAIPGVDWRSQIGIMERISLVLGAQGEQGFN